MLSTDVVQTNTLVFPSPLLKATRIEDSPTLKEVLLAKAERSAQLLRWSTPYEINDIDFALQ